MANSAIVTALKNAVMDEIMKDENLFYAIDSPQISDFTQSDKLLYTHLFPFHKNPDTITENITFLTFQVHIPKSRDRNNNSLTWVTPQLEIWILSHTDHMVVDNIPKIRDNRNDYISKLIDKKFNGKDTFGGNIKDSNNVHIYGRLELLCNVEGTFSKDFLYRQMIFEMKDLNYSLCDEK